MVVILAKVISNQLVLLRQGKTGNMSIAKLFKFGISVIVQILNQLNALND